MTLTVLGTTDLHGHVFDWDYGAGAPYADDRGNHVGLARCASIIREERAARPAGSCLTLDAGDIIQGTPLAHRFARSGRDEDHPMASAMNAVGYDAAAVGNHDFNYGLDVLHAFERQLDFPLLGGNVLDTATGEPLLPPYAVRTLTAAGRPPLKVAVIGLVTPGVAIWDRAQVEGRVQFDGIVERASVLVPEARRAGADVVVVACHSGTDGDATSYGTQLPFPENASTMLARRVPDIDAILVGHAHVEIPERIVRHEHTDRPVLLSEPLCLGMRVSVMELDLEHDGGTWQVIDRRARLRSAAEAGEDDRVTAAAHAAHTRVCRELSEVVATSVCDMPGASARFRPSDVIDLVNHVQAQTLSRALADTLHRDLPVLSVTSPYNRHCLVPRGDVSVRDLAGVYIHESTLVGVLLTGRELTAYLEHAAAYFRRVRDAGTVRASWLTCAPTERDPQGMPDFGYDVLGGLEEQVGYDLDLAAPVGRRVHGLRHGDRLVGTDDVFAVAVNSYRQAGGSHYPAVVEAPVVHDGGRPVRDLLIEWSRSRGRLDPAEFAGSAWRLMVGDEPLEVRP